MKPSARVIENIACRIEWNPEQPSSSLRITNKLSGTSFQFPVSSPGLSFNNDSLFLEQIPPSSVAPDVDGTRYQLEYEYPPQSMNGFEFTFRAMLEIVEGMDRLYWIPSIQVKGPKVSQESLSVSKIILLSLPIPGPVVFSQEDWQSYPVLTDDLFIGVEWPIACASISNDLLSLSYSPQRELKPKDCFDGRPIVIGFSAKGGSLEAFHEYIEEFRVQNDRIHLNFNSWWTLGFPFTEKELLEVYDQLEANLVDQYDVYFDTLTLDLGWSAKEAIWQIHPENFPEGFKNLNRRLRKMNGKLGLWWSPSNNYSPHSFDSIWAQSAGYESLPSWNPEQKYMCIAKGTRYQKETLMSLMSLVKKWDLCHVKFDGLIPECPEPNHGHAPGENAREVLCKGLIEIMQAMRKAKPDIWMEVHCFGPTPSPWLAMFADCLVGGIGDDYPNGVVPAPFYKESYTTSRDFFNMHNARFPLPPKAHDLFGVIHQTAEPIFNDGVMVILRGNQFNSFYLNPKFMIANNWRFVAELMNWSRANWDLLRNTKMILPKEWEEDGITPYSDATTMPRQTYGYSHWKDGEILLALRNPWMDMDLYELELTEDYIGSPQEISGWSAYQVWPVPRPLARGLKTGGTLTVLMGPYETKVIRMKRDKSQTIPSADPKLQCLADIKRIDAQSKLTKSRGVENTFRWRSTVRGESNIEAKLFYLIESTNPFLAESPTIKINGKNNSFEILDSETGWSAAQPNWKQNNWRWYVVNAPLGTWEAKADFTITGEKIRVHAWLVGNRPAVAEATPAQWQFNPPFPNYPDYMMEVSITAV